MAISQGAQGSKKMGQQYIIFGDPFWERMHFLPKKVYIVQTQGTVRQLWGFWKVISKYIGLPLMQEMPWNNSKLRNVMVSDENLCNSIIFFYRGWNMFIGLIE